MTIDLSKNNNASENEDHLNLVDLVAQCQLRMSELAQMSSDKSGQINELSKYNINLIKLIGIETNKKQKLIKSLYKLADKENINTENILFKEILNLI